jgi:hypothetical protein
MVRKLGSNRWAIADRTIGLQDHALDIDVGGDGRLAAFSLWRVSGGRAGDNQRGGKQGGCRTRQRRAKKRDQR